MCSYSCGIALDIWTFPLDQDFYTVGLTQPVVFINSYVFLKWAMNLEGVLKLLKSPNENGKLIFYTLYLSYFHFIYSDFVYFCKR